MRITCWGSRGSIPVSGPDFNRYGGDTTCLEIRSADDDILIVDAGTGIRLLGNTLFTENRRRFNFLFTHAHWDHLMGFPFFKPLYCENVELQIFKCPFPNRYVTKMISSVMAPPHFPLRFSDLKAQITYLDACPKRFEAGSVAITPIALSHPNSGFGYKFSENGKSFVFLTDNELKVKHPKGLPYSAYLEFVRDADLLLHDAEYTPAEHLQKMEWGHSAYTDALELALQAGVRRFGLFHHNQERTDAQLDAIVADCRQRVAAAGKQMECFAVAAGMHLEV
ncbi:MAG: MBL fold metallo-hydrolase [Desulfobacterales bacterium]